jgi:ribonuclease HI
MTDRKKFYVVWKGRQPGIYKSWAECAAQVSGYPEAKFKAFATEAAARQALAGDWRNYIGLKPVDHPLPAEVRVDSISVDAACDGSPGNLEYRGVDTKTGKVIFHVGPLKNGTANVGEFLAIVHALALLKKKKLSIPVYSDSRNAINWVKKRWVKTKLPRNEDTEQVWKLIDRALNWLAHNQYSNPLLKWETDKWGEIRADFGRK